MALRFSPTAWAKLLLVRDLGDTEVGGFGITACEDLLYVKDIRLVRQVCTGVSVAFDDQAVADFFDEEVDRGHKPEQFARIWIHTHPGHSAEPSSVDEATFRRVFGRTEWAVMAILPREGRAYARLRFHVGPGGESELPVQVDYQSPFPASAPEAWRAEYQATVVARTRLTRNGPAELGFDDRFEPFDVGDEWLDTWPDLFTDPPEDKEPCHGIDL